MRSRAKRFAALLALFAWIFPALVFADQQPGKGKLLVANDLVVGDMFAKTVVLLLHYDERGAMGLVINRPTEIPLTDFLGDEDVVPSYSNGLYWGGPVEMNSLRALMLSEIAPEDAITVFGSVHHVPIDEGLHNVPDGTARLRFFVGYAGWGPGQLDHEMARGSWHVVPATNEHVFAEDPHALWDQLKAAPKFRVAIPEFVEDAFGQIESAGH